MLIQQRRHYGDQHTHGAKQIPSDGRTRGGKPFDAQNKKDRGHQVGDIDEVLLHGRFTKRTVCLTFAFEHRKHAVRDEETADHVDRRQDDGA